MSLRDLFKSGTACPPVQYNFTRLIGFNGVQVIRPSLKGETDVKIETLIRRSLLGFAVAGLLATGAWAQSAGSSGTPAQSSDIQKDRKDKRQDKRDIRADRKDRNADTRDIRGDRRDRNADNRDIRQDRRQLARSNAKNGVDSKRSQALRRDIRSDRKDRNADNRDIHNDKRDRRADNRDIRHDKRDVRRDRRDIRHDRRGH
jgi:hypothetical protein